MKNSTAIRFLAYTAFFIIPTISLINCNSWSANTGSINQCFLEVEFLKAIAESLWGLIYISAFLVFTPLMLIIAIVILAVEFTASKFK
ncbi:hypothetical protein [Cellvibrio fibrivorans]|uniref:Uncharacterized protein n=2 Tax=Cellvibrio TaxID=10 RepID=A0ABU1V4F0_9GAMM|nr:hypothetical protein [Cellvibrio fibrivorans]MDR7092257.1 hypothetical protein [Cellvibrio fibrivorans]